MLRRIFLAIGLLVLLFAGCRGESAPRETGAAASGIGKRLRIAVIPKGTTHEFWKAVHAGAVKASRELDVDVVWKGPLREDDLKAQVDLVQSFVSQAVAGVVLAPLNDKALVAPVRAATAARIPVVIFDSGLRSDEPVSFVATDNRAAGRLGGERLAKLVGKGSAVLLRYQEGSASTAEREQGFLDAMRAHPETRVVSDNQYGGATTESAFAASESLLAAQGATKGTVSGVFCPNESTTFGMLLALRKANVAGKIRFIGFDASDKLLQALKEGHIDGLVLQNPFSMGYLAVKTMVQHLRGTKVERRIDTGAVLVDRDNVDKAEIRELIHPDLEKWLGK